MPGRLEPKPVPRRDVLGLAGLGSAIVAIVGALIGMARLPKPRVTPEASSRFRAGKPAAFPPGSVTVIPDRKVRIASTAEGFAALSLVCTHLGCIVQETEHGFLCPCHGSAFDAKGAVLGGPAPRGLMWLAMAQAPDGSLVIDAAREVPAGTYYKV